MYYRLAAIHFVTDKGTDNSRS